MARKREPRRDEAASTMDSWQKIISQKEMDDFPWPDPNTVDFSYMQEASKCLPEGMKIISGVGGIFTRVWMLLGFENFSLNLYENPTLIKKMYDRIGGIQCQVLRKIVQMKNIGAFWYGDDLAYTEGLMVAPEIYREYLFPWLEELFSIAKECGLPVIMHSDGDVSPLIDDLIGMGLNALHPIEPKAMDITELKQKYRDRLCLFGNIDLAGVLTRGRPQDVTGEVKERIEILAPGGGYGVGSSNSVAYYVPIENYKAMLQAAFDYGEYPI